MTRTNLEGRIRAAWPSIVEKSGCDVLRSFQALPTRRLELLGSSVKTELGEAQGVLTGVQYLAPGSGSGRNVCPNSTAACRAGCLGDHAGRMPTIRGSMQWKAALRFGAPELYFELLRLCTRGLVKRAARQGLRPAVRLDGTSDLGDACRIAGEFPMVQWYDYTKSPARAARVLRSGALNHHTTLSFSGTNRAECVAFLAIGGTVAVPFDIGKGDTLPALWEGFAVIDGDVDDYRPNDPKGSVVGLYWKGPNWTREAARVSGWLQGVA